VWGTDTRAWPFLLGGAVVAGCLALFGILRRLLLLLGLVTLAAGAALIHYVLNVIDIATRRDSLEHAVAHLSLVSSAGPGPFVLLGAGVCIFLGASAPRRRLDAVRPGGTAFDGAPRSTSKAPRAQQEPEAG
jgi:hypothetical protein